MRRKRKSYFAETSTFFNFFSLCISLSFLQRMRMTKVATMATAMLTDTMTAMKETVHGLKPVFEEIRVDGEGFADDGPEGAEDGKGDGKAEGATEGEGDGAAEGKYEGAAEVDGVEAAEGENVGAAEDDGVGAEGEGVEDERATEGAVEGEVVAMGEAATEGAAEGEGEGETRLRLIKGKTSVEITSSVP